jgi:hypothetical protein
MDHEGLPCSQEPASSPCPESDESKSTPSYPISFKINFNIILPAAPTSPKWSLTFWFSDQNAMKKAGTSTHLTRFRL